MAVRFEEPININIKYHTDIPNLKKIPQGDWIDLYAGEYISLKAGEYKLISLGVSMELPEGYEALVVPRSSTPKNFGIVCANSIGVIDNSYKGDDDIWRFPAYALRDTDIKKGDRICQFRIIKSQPELVFTPVTSLENESRGGIGSTGTR